MSLEEDIAETQRVLQPLFAKPSLKVTDRVPHGGSLKRRRLVVTALTRRLDPNASTSPLLVPLYHHRHHRCRVVLIL